MNADRICFLIDADNVSVDVIENALELKTRVHGAIHVRRCYCSADFALKNLAFLKEHSIRPMVNATAGKNCTDIALAVDAVQLCMHERPKVVVIVASDSDFAPLVLQLRDLGCRVEGVGQEGKTGAESHRAYDEFVDLPTGRRRAARARAARPPARSPARAPAKRVEPATAKAVPALPPEVEAILDAVPGLGSGKKVSLNIATEALRKHKLLSKSTPSTKVFKKHADFFVLSPADQPNAVQFRARD